VNRVLEIDDMISTKVVESHPLDGIIRSDRMPHIWCPGCGIGIVMRCYAQAIIESGIDWMFRARGWIYEY